MFGRSKPVVLEPSGRRRSKRIVPRWLLLLLAGVGVGAGGLLYVQERHLPPRLSADASAQLRTSLEQADRERADLRDRLGAAAKRLDTALAEKQTLSRELAASREAVQALRGDVASLVAALPPDPRGGAVQVRAARFTAEDGRLLYDLVLARGRAKDKPLNGVVQLVVAGDAPRGSSSTMTPDPITVSIGAYESVRGELALPASFKPRQTTVKVLDRAGGKLLGMRVMHVK